jgi:hypothetical protein
MQRFVKLRKSLSAQLSGDPEGTPEPIRRFAGTSSRTAPYPAAVGRFEVWRVCDKLCLMLFMVIEHFKQGNPRPIAERFKSKGRMLPEGVRYHASWVDSTGARCFQIMEARHLQLLDAWIACWDDLVDFEVIPVMTSADFWARPQSEGSQ